MDEKLIPESLKDYVYFVDGQLCAKQKLPKDLEREYEEFKKICASNKCPICGADLEDVEGALYLDGIVKHCPICDKYFLVDRFYNVTEIDYNGGVEIIYQ